VRDRHEPALDVSIDALGTPGHAAGRASSGLGLNILGFAGIVVLVWPDMNFE
jgi:hypothetical protein